MAEVTTDGVSIAYNDEGRGDPPFVFVHGWATDHTVWQMQVDALKRDHRCLSIDLRGRGGSSLDGPYDMMTAADDVARVVRELRVPRAIFVGHDTGSLVVLMLNERHPDLACGVVLGDPPLNAARSGDLDKYAREILAAESLDPMRNLVESYFVESTPHEVREQVRQLVASCPLQVAAGMFEPGMPLEGKLGEMVRTADSRPFMVFWGMNPPGRPEQLREITMFLRQEPIAEAGHFFQLEKPAVTTALLRAFVDDVNRDPRLQLEA